MVYIGIYIQVYTDTINQCGVLQPMIAYIRSQTTDVGIYLYH